MIKLFICGDIVNLYNDHQFISDELIGIIKSADYSIGNLEGGLSITENKMTSTQILQHPSTIKFLKEAGFNMLLLANNHITDGGKEILNHTINKIKLEGIDYIGAGFQLEEVYKGKIVELNGLKIGFINVCEAHEGYFKDKNKSFGYAWLGHPLVENNILNIRQQVDRLLVFVHAGLEHYDLPLVEFRKLYRKYCDLGADCVIASHPHVPQGIELYKNKLIFYSLGNFYFPRSLNEKEDNIENYSYSIILKFNQNEINYEPIFHQTKNSKVFLIDSSQSKINLTRLCKNLDESIYNSLIDTIYQSAYKKLIYNLYLESLKGTTTADTLMTSLKYVIKYLFFRKKNWEQTERYRNKLLLHLLRNETYRYVAEHILTKNYEPKN